MSHLIDCIAASMEGSDSEHQEDRGRHGVTASLLKKIALDVEALRKQGCHPTELHLTPDNAIRLQYELIAEGGPRAHSIMLGGLRRAVPQLDGLRIVWKSVCFRVA